MLCILMEDAVKRFTWLIFFLALPLFATGPALTTVADTFYYPAGVAASGTIEISNHPFTSPDGHPILPADTTTQFYNGAISVQLVPTQGATPDKQLYTVKITPQGGPMVLEYWSVPVSSGSVTFPQVITYQQPMPSPIIGVPAGGTGATTPAGAAANLGVPTGVYTGILSAGNTTATCDMSARSSCVINPLVGVNITTLTIQNFVATGIGYDFGVCEAAGVTSSVNFSSVPFHGSWTPGTTAGKCSFAHFSSPNGTGLYLTGHTEDQ
jgi:hypothetical protein